MITTEKLPQPKLGEIVVSVCLEGYSGQEIGDTLAKLFSYSPRLCYQDEYNESGFKVTVSYAYLATINNFAVSQEIATSLVALGIDTDAITVVGKGNPREIDHENRAISNKSVRSLPQ
jgi:hypothetical protein